MASVKPTILKLRDALLEVTADWYTLGLRLDISTGTLNAIKATNHEKVDDCMNDMLQKWLGKYPDRGWSDIITALRAMERNDIANEVAMKYCNSTADSSSLGMFTVGTTTKVCCTFILRGRFEGLFLVITSYIFMLPVCYLQR